MSPFNGSIMLHSHGRGIKVEPGPGRHRDEPEIPRLGEAELESRLVMMPWYPPPLSGVLSSPAFVSVVSDTQ